MAEKQKTRIVNLYITPGTFTSIFKRLRGDRSDYDFSGLADLRQLLSKEKARVLNTIKNQKPESIYHLAKILGRDFKSVNQDVKLLQKFGFIELKQESKGNRKKLRPEIEIDSLQINISFQ
jgi:predicted transcriptional regulator